MNKIIRFKNFLPKKFYNKIKSYHVYSSKDYYGKQSDNKIRCWINDNPNFLELMKYFTDDFSIIMEKNLFNYSDIYHTIHFLTFLTYSNRVSF